MTAREMFEELGYVYYDNHYLEYTCKENEGELIIRFYQYGELVTASAFIYRDDRRYMVSAPLNMRELKAVMKQCEELGWLNH